MGSQVGNPLATKTSSMAREPGKARTAKRLSIRLGAIDVGAIAERLRELHRLGSDPQFERFPDPSELFLVLLHAERTASELKQPEKCQVSVVGESAVLPAKLWQYLREQADSGQLKAIEPAAPPGCRGITSVKRCACRRSRAPTRRPDAQGRAGP